MSRVSVSFATALSLTVATLALSAGPLQAADDAAPVRKFLATYCNNCHGETKQKADRRFDQLVLPVSKADTLIDLKDILDQLHLGDMPASA